MSALSTATKRLVQELEDLKITGRMETVLTTALLSCAGNDTHKLLWDFNIHTDHQISTRRPDLIIINKKKRTCKIVDFAVPADHRIKLKVCKEG